MRAKMTRLEKTARKIVRENFDIDIVLGNIVYSSNKTIKTPKPKESQWLRILSTR